ncbi:hypothetical protein [Streptomyces sp. NPDC056188]|uniref:hypothetical protein n=1 Tax=Streptomyces sp. NPDC056188 TaxID=3345740 RepID=UPI0035E0A979
MTVEQEILDRLHAEALAENEQRSRPYCTGDRCQDCIPPDPKDPYNRYGESGCCEATCGCCPRVNEHGLCFLRRGSEDDSKCCDQHGEGWLNDRSPEAERRYQILRNA